MRIALLRLEEKRRQQKRALQANLFHVIDVRGNMRTRGLSTMNIHRDVPDGVCNYLLKRRDILLTTLILFSNLGAVVETSPSDGDKFSSLNRQHVPVCAGSMI
jgi:hypothetical protein